MKEGIASTRLNTNNSEQHELHDISEDEDILNRYEESLQVLCCPSRRVGIPIYSGLEWTGRKGDAVVRDIIRHSETVLRYDERALCLQNDWEPSSWTYTFRSQIRSGGRKGMGGRPVGTTIDVRRHFESLLQTVLAIRLVEISDSENFSLQRIFHPPAIERLRELHSKGLSNLYKGHFAALPGNFLGIHAKFTQRDSPNSRGDGAEVLMANARERHLLCLWIDLEGKARCSCIGKTLFSAKSSARQFDEPCCIHAEQLYRFFDSLISPFATNRQSRRFNALQILSNTLMYTAKSTESFLGLNRTAVFVAFKDYPDVTGCGVMWVPIRLNPKRRSALTCAFCDNRTESNCAHILEWKRSRELSSMVMQGTSQNSESHLELEWQYAATPASHDDNDYGEDHLGRSYLPIGPINCPSAVKFDTELARYVKAGGAVSEDQTRMVYIVHAPLRCQKCGFERDELTRKELDEGVLSCTTGPVRMKVESFRCTNLVCGALIYEEGRRNHIVFHSFTSAATHVFMRREIQAVVLSGGTIANRFANYLRNRIEDRYSGVIPQDASMRSSRTLSDLFSLTLRLMVIDPSPSLFACNSCGVDGRKEFSVVCIDGIWAGYDRKSTTELVSISESCDPIPSGRITAHRARPNGNMFRSQVVPRVLAAIIADENQKAITESTVGAALATLRILQPDLIPEDWNVEPFFSNTKSGEEVEQLLSSFREITFLLFKRDKMISRLAKAMNPYVTKRLQRLKSDPRKTPSQSVQRNSRRKMSEQELLTYSEIIEKVIALGQRPDNLVPVQTLVSGRKVCWNDAVLAISNEARSNIYRFYMLILDGPLTQFILHSEVSSLKEIADVFLMSGSTMLIRKFLLNMHSRETKSIIKSNRLLMSSLLSVLELQDAIGNDNAFIKAFGNVLHAICEVISVFYESYSDFPDSEATSLVYKRRWEQASPRLFRRYLRRNAEVRKGARGHNDLFKSGVFLPNHPQVRAMPFNDKADFRSRHRDYGSCSKHYDAQRPDFTPGAITFCCACSHPIIFGFKTLERGEGPRAVLDVLISRFPVLPRFVVYDFACGLFRSAQHTLWWAMKNTTFVSDRFHVDNHTCHRGFHPDSYNYLNGRNTVSHEQRNRPIASLKESLRNCSQSLYVSLLAYHSLYLNLKAKIRQMQTQMKAEKGTSVAEISGVKKRKKSSGDELSNDEVQTWYFNKMRMPCPCCPSLNTLHTE